MGEPPGLAAFLAKQSHPSAFGSRKRLTAPRAPSGHFPGSLPALSGEGSPRSRQQDPSQNTSHWVRERMRQRLQLRSSKAALAVLIESWLADKRVYVKKARLAQALNKMDINVTEDQVHTLFRAFNSERTDRLEVRQLHDAIWKGRRDPHGSAVTYLLSHQAPRGAQSPRDASWPSPRGAVSEPSRSPRSPIVHFDSHGPGVSPLLKAAFEPSASEDSEAARPPTRWVAVANSEGRLCGKSPRRIRPPPPPPGRPGLRKLDSAMLGTYRRAAAELGSHNAEEAKGRCVEMLRDACVRNGPRIIELLVSCDMRAESEVSPPELLFALRAVGLHATLADAEALYASWLADEEEALLFSTLVRTLRHDGKRDDKPQRLPLHERDQASSAKKIQQEIHTKVGRVQSRQEEEMLLRRLGEQKDQVLALFKKWDRDKTGIIDREELRKGVTQLGLPARSTDVDALFALMDPDGTGVVELSELSRSASPIIATW